MPSQPAYTDDVAANRLMMAERILAEKVCSVVGAIDYTVDLVLIDELVLRRFSRE